MDVECLYWQFRELGLARSQVEFSQVWLGRSPRYYSHLMAECRQPGLATLTALRWRIARLVAELQPSVLRDQLERIEVSLAESIELRSIVDIRTRTAKQSALFDAELRPDHCIV